MAEVDFGHSVASVSERIVIWKIAGIFLLVFTSSS